MHGDAFGDDGAAANGAPRLVQGVAKDGEENNWRNDGLESEEILDLCVGNAQEGQLEQEVEEECHESGSRKALALGHMVGNSGETWPNCLEQNGYTLSAGDRLNTACDPLAWLTL